MLVEPKCFERGCKHFLGVAGDDEETERPRCEAFPQAAGMMTVSSPAAMHRMP